MGSGPYRAGSGAEETSVPGDAGIVGELIEQFADPLAFYRELIQNAIDAGTESIRVSLVWEGLGEQGGEGEPPSGVTHVSVRDEGEGMDRDVLENQLLVLFRSGKEGQEGKIGKFGVGFVSVLAVQPSVVVVHTSRGGGRAWALHLHPDQSYDLFELEGGEASGTTVTLRVPMGRDEYEGFIDRSERALRRWCRHARVPIRFSAQLSGATDPLTDVRVDRDLDLQAIVSVERTYDGVGRLVVGLGPPGKPYSAFFNQGLLLWETIGPLIHPFSFKVQDSRLEHTLSRDNVRRDAAFERALAAVREAAREQLPTAAFSALEDAARSCRDGHYLALATSLAEAYPERHLRWTFPLIEPIGEQRTIRATDVSDRPLHSQTRSELTAALAEQRVPVVDVGEEGELLAVVTSVLRGRPRDAHASLTLVVPVEPTAVDLLLLEKVCEHLRLVVRSPNGPVLATLVGAGARRAVMSAGEGGRPWVVTEREASQDPLRFLARPRMVINASNRLVAAARRRAALDPELAATTLARAVLLWTRRLDEETDEALATAGLEHLLGGAR